MSRLSSIIGELYNKYLPLVENTQVQLNLDFPNTTQEVDEPEIIKASLDAQLQSALSRTKKGKITIAVRDHAIIISDSDTVLSKPVCAMLSSDNTEVKSRVGFGTTIKIKLKKPTEPTK